MSGILGFEEQIIIFEILQNSRLANQNYENLDQLVDWLACCCQSTSWYKLTN